jgi:hypothetical protein
MNSQDESRQVMAYVLRRAITDPAFRQGLLTNPRLALETEFNLELPATFRIRFVENQGADLTVVLPDPVSNTHHLSDRDLEYVAGGAGWEGLAALVQGLPG